MRTRLRKWYFDLLAPDDVYVFAYFAELTHMRQTLLSVKLHCAMPGRAPQTVSFSESKQIVEEAGEARSIRFPDGAIDIAGDECHLVFSRDLCRVDLHFLAGEPVKSPPLEIPGPPGGRILWKPVSLKYLVSGEVNIGSDLLTVSEASGYADYMQSTISPSRIPVRMLHWGRIHHDEFDLAYSYCQGDRENWSRLFLKSGGRSSELKVISLVESPLPGESFDLQAEGPSDQLELHVQHLCPVQQGGVVDPQMLRTWMLRSLLGGFSSSVQSTKYLSWGDVKLSGAEQRYSNLDMIDEVVHLGRLTPGSRFHLRKSRPEKVH